MNHSITSRGENILRWVIALFTPLIIAIPLLLLVLKAPRPVLSERPPALQLEYVVITPKEEETPKPPKEVKRVVVKKTEKSAPKKRAIAKVEESLPSETPADIEAGTPEPVKDEPAPKADAEPVHHVITSEEELDNTAFSPLYNPKPSYPVIARKQRITGYVDLDLVINEKGKVISFLIVKSYGHPTFGEETAKVIRRWRFPPPRIKGKKVKVTYRYRVNFKLNQ